MKMNLNGSVERSSVLRVLPPLIVVLLVLTNVFLSFSSVPYESYTWRTLGHEDKELPLEPSEQQTWPGEGSFSACLLIMDDNHRLTEWLAYHYHTLPLRHVVAAVDPHSRTSPSKLFQRWRDNAGMTIEEWTDSNFTNASLARKETDNFEVLKNKHRARQNRFYQACAAHLKSRNKTWVMFIDTDEFLTVHSEAFKDYEDRLHQPGGILKALNEIRSNQTLGQMWPYSHYNKSNVCITIPRIAFSPVESPQQEIKKGVPDFVDPTRFDTLRWRYRLSKRGGADGLAKSIMDVSAFDLTVEVMRAGGNAHRPLTSVCPDPWITYEINDNPTPLGIHHYIGSWEAYSFREDARAGEIRNREWWEKRSMKQEGGVDDEIRPWISGFVKYVGEKQAQLLLRDAGLPKGYKKAANDTTIGFSQAALLVAQSM